MTIITEIAGWGTQVQRPPCGAAPPAQLCNYKQEVQIVPVQTRPGSSGSRRSLGLDINGRHDRAWKDLLMATGRAGGDVLTVCAARSSLAPPGGSRGTAMWEEPFHVTGAFPGSTS